MKKVAFLVSRLGSGGAERVISVLATYFAKKYKVTLFVFSDDSKYAIDDKIEIIKLDSVKSKFKKVINRCNQIHEYMKKNSITTIITFELYYALVLSKYKDIKTITSCRNYPKLEFKSPIGRLIQYVTFMRVSHVVFQTNEQKILFKRIKNYSIIPNPINDEVFKIQRKAAEKKIVAVSRIEKQKNLKLLIDAMIDFHSEYDYTLEIYGEGQLLQSYIDYVEEKEASDYIFFKGFCADVLTQISNAAAFVLTSNFEGMPNSLLEAMSIGIYSIATDSYGGGARALLRDNFNGKLIPMNDKEALVEALKMLENNSELVKQMEINAIHDRDKYASDAIGAQWETLI